MKKWTLILAVMASFLWVEKANAQLPDGLTYDDAYVWLTLENYDVNKKGKRLSDGWALEAKARIIGKDLPNRSALKYVIKSGRKKLGEVRCELGPVRDGYTKDQWTARCLDRKQRIKKKGKITIDVIFINGDDDKESVIRTHTVSVEELKRVRGTGDKDASLFFVNRNAETQVAWINLVPGSQYPYFAGRNSRHDRNTIEIIFNAAPVKWNGKSDDKGDSFDDNGAFFRCKVDGKTIKLENDEARVRELDQKVYLIHTWAQGRRDERDQVSYRQFRVQTPFTFGEDKKRSRATALAEHPGTWTCDIKNNGKTLRSFSWTVAADGNVAPHPEEEHLGLGPWAHLITTTIPKKTNFETRVDPKGAKKMGFFYGHKAQSKEAKAWANLPRIGNPLPKKLK